MLFIVAGLIFIALAFDFINGFHDAANSIATVVSTRVLSPGRAVIWAAFFNFIAAFTFGTAVAKTIGSGMIDIEIVMAVLDRIDSEPAAHELGDQPLHQGRLAGILPAGDAEDTLLAHGAIRSALA